MTKYLIEIIVAIIIYVPFSVASYYTKNRKGKNYELLDGITQLSNAFVWLGIGHWMLDLFFEGEDSAIGWILLTYIIGAMLTSCLNILVRKLCEQIWPKNPEMVIESKKMSKRLGLAIDVVATLIYLAFSGFFCCGLIFHRAEMNTSDIILISLVTLLFIAGAINMGQKTFKDIQHR